MERTPGVTGVASGMLMKLAAISLALYLGIAPIYWLPGVPLEALRLVKWLLISFSTVLVWLLAMSSGVLSVPRGPLGPAAMAILVAACYPGMMQSEYTAAVSRMADLLLGIIVIWTVFNLLRTKQVTGRIIGIPVVIMLIACSITLLAGIGLLSQGRFISPADFGSSPVSATGFGARRTGWSNGVALVMPAALWWGSRVFVTRRARVFGVLLVVAILMGAQIVVGGRAGLLASVVVLAVLGRPLLSMTGTAVVALSSFGAVVVLRQFAVEQLRINRLQSGSLYTAIDGFSAGRLAMYVEGLQLFSERPLLGHGFGSYELQAFDGELHNVWLRLLVEAGPFLPLVFGGIVLTALFRVRRTAHAVRGRYMSGLGSDDGSVAFAVYATLLAGVVVSMFEPAAPLGSFQASAVWWVALGAVPAVSRMRRAKAYGIESLRTRSMAAASERLNPSHSKGIKSQIPEGSRGGGC